MAKATLKCFGCKQEFRREELISYTPVTAKNAYNYCKDCLKEKQARERFSDKVCSIFGIKAPGPRIWTERKRIMNTYGYTDDIIIDCLEYIYKIQKCKKLSESLCLITPTNVARMINWKTAQTNQAGNLLRATNVEQLNECVVTTQKKKERNVVFLNADDYLEGDEW